MAENMDNDKGKVFDITSPKQGRRIWPLFILILVLISCAVLLTSLDEIKAEKLIYIISAILSITGVLGLFLWSVGILTFGSNKEPENILKSAIDDNDVATLITNSDNEIIYANQAYIELTSLDTSKVRHIDKSFTKFPEISENIYRLFKAGSASKSHEETAQMYFQHGDGRVAKKWYNMKVKQVNSNYGENYNIWQIYNVIHDKDLKEDSFKEFQDIINYIDQAPVGFFSIDGNGNIDYINSTLARWLKIDIGLSFDSKLKLKDIIRKQDIDLFKHSGQNNEIVREDVLELDLKRSDNIIFPAKIVIRGEYDKENASYSMHAIVLSLDEDIEGEGYIANAEIRFARLFNNAPIGIATLNKKGLIKAANGHFVSLFKGMVSVGDDITLLKDGYDDEEAIKKAVESALENIAKIKPVDLRFDKNPNENFSSVKIFISILRSNNSDSESVIEGNNEEDMNDNLDEVLVVYAIDTTEQTLLEDKMSQGQKMQAVGTLAGGIAHDFNNVLTSIIGSTDMLLEDHLPSDPSFKDIIDIKHSANRAAALVRQLLAFSRRQTLRPQMLQLKDVLTDFHLVLNRSVSEKIKIQIEHQSDLWYIKADLNELERVFLNLVVNAKDAMDDGGEIKITTSNIDKAAASKLNYPAMEVGEYVLCEVSDTGSGIDEENLNKIFEPFFTTKEVGKGTGLGLATVYGIVKQTGGFIYAETEMGKGTIFKVYLPRYIPEKSEIEDKFDNKEKAKGTDLTGEGRILLVEDEESVRRFAARALSTRGYEVVEAGNGQIALELYKEHDGNFDLVISDVVMPEMDGPTLIAELRKLKYDKKLVFMSGYAEDAFERNLDKDEEFTFLPKPFTLKLLAKTAKDTINS